MTALHQALVTSSATQPSPWRSNSALSVSETITPRPRKALWPGNREITLEVSRNLRERPWFHPTLTRMLMLLALDHNWNGYGERAVHEAAVKRAIDVLDVVGVDGPRPDVVPTSGGGVQLEWAGGGCEIEVEIPPVGLAAVFIVEASGEESEVLAGARNAVWEKLRARIAAMGDATV